MQQTLDRSWWKDARFAGVLRYHQKTLGRIILWTMLILIASQVIAFLAPLVFDATYTYGGVSTDLGATMVVAFLCAVGAAHRATRFFLRFGTSRFSVWLGNVVALCAAMVALLLATMLLSILMGGLTLAMANTLPRKYVFQQYFGDLVGSRLYGDSFVSALKTLPRYILYTMEWTALFYLLGCCLRRNRGLTIAIIVGIPLMMMILTLIPAVREAVRVVENGNESQMMILGVQWMKFFSDVAHFIQQKWQIIQLLAAVVSLPLSYLCMRETPQP